eukprot:244542_1
MLINTVTADDINPLNPSNNITVDQWICIIQDILGQKKVSNKNKKKSKIIALVSTYLRDTGNNLTWLNKKIDEHNYQVMVAQEQTLEAIGAKKRAGAPAPNTKKSNDDAANDDNLNPFLPRPRLGRDNNNALKQAGSKSMFIMHNEHVNNEITSDDEPIMMQSMSCIPPHERSEYKAMKALQSSKSQTMNKSALDPLKLTHIPRKSIIIDGSGAELGFDDISKIEKPRNEEETNEETTMQLIINSVIDIKYPLYQWVGSEIKP